MLFQKFAVLDGGEFDRNAAFDAADDPSAHFAERDDVAHFRNNIGGESCARQGYVDNPADMFRTIGQNNLGERVFSVRSDRACGLPEG